MGSREPVAPIPQREWIPDGEVADCMKCNTQFTCFFRRHHCRYCGFVLCFQCSDKLYNQMRCCAACYQRNMEAEKRLNVLNRTPSLSRVQHLSSSVQFEKGAGDKAGSSSRAKVEKKGADVIASPRIERSIHNLEKMYGNEGGKGKSPLLSKNLPQPAPVVEKKRKAKSSRAKFSRGPNDVLIVVDPFSTGAVLVAEILSRGCKVIRVLSDEFPEHILNLVLEGIRVEYVATIPHKGHLESTIEKIQACIKDQGLTCMGCTPGCETGVELSDAIAEALGLRGNGTRLSDMRRNKYLMQEQVRKAGIRAVMQTKAQTMHEVTAFLNKFGSGPMKLVIKPVASAGTDNVYVCRSKEEVRKRFQQILGSTNILGKKNVEVVIQEFLEGKEYVVDTVSCDGVHKVITIWEYDKRPCNGADFVYFGLRLKSVDEPRCKELIEYQKQVLDALDIKHGAGHGEVIFTPTGPCLVEVGARPHGGEGSWVPLVNKCLGTSQVKALVDVFLDPDAFDATPDEPRLKDWFGCEVDFVAREAGILQALPKIDEIKKLKSYFEHDMFVKPGEKLTITVDCITTPGNVRLCARDRADMEADFARLREMELDGFFVVKKNSAPPEESDKKAKPKAKPVAPPPADADDEDDDESPSPDKSKLDS